MQKRWFYVFFILINLLLSSYYLDVWLTPNATSRVLPVLTMYENRTIQIDKYKDYTVDKSGVKGHYYSDKAPLGTFLVYPFYYAYKSLGLAELKDSTLKKYPIYILSTRMEDGIINFPDGRLYMLPKTSTVFLLADILCCSIPFTIALFLALLAASKADNKASVISPVVAVMLSFYASFLFAYAGTYTGHILSGVFVLTGYIFIKKKNYLPAGLMVGLAVASEFTVGILIPLWGILIFFNERKISKPLLFGAGLIPGLLFIMLYNMHVTGSPLLTPYSYLANTYAQKNVGFTYPRLDAFLGITFSTYRGMLFYAPVLIVLFWYIIKRNMKTLKGLYAGRAKDIVVGGIKNYLLVTVIVYTLLISSYFMWSGGWAYGPRQIIPLVLICLYEGVSYLVSNKISPYFFYIASAIGLLFTWMDKSTKIYELPDDFQQYHNPVFNIVIPDFFQHRFNTNMLPVLMFDCNPVMAIIFWPLLFLAGLLILNRWYVKLNPLLGKRFNFYIPVACLFVIYTLMLIPQSKAWKDSFNVNRSGIYGMWDSFQLANEYRDTAQNIQDSAKKRKYYLLAGHKYKKVTAVWTGYAEGFYYSALCFDALGYKDSAIMALKKTLKVAPGFTPAENYLGVIYRGMRQYDSAIHYFNGIYLTDHNNREAVVNIAKTYQIGKIYDSAYHYYNLAAHLQ